MRVKLRRADWASLGLVVALLVSACSSRESGSQETPTGGDQSPASEASGQPTEPSSATAPAAEGTGTAPDAAPAVEPDASSAPAPASDATPSAPDAAEAASGGDASTGSAETDPDGAAPSWAPPTMSEADGLRVTEIAACTGVESATPVDPRRAFSKATDERVYCFVRLANPESQASQITLSWEQPGTPAPSRRRDVQVPARNRFGTYAFITTGHRSGRWECVIRTSSDAVIGRIDFDITD